MDKKVLQNLHNEIVWYEDNPWIKRDHFLMKWPFVEPKRHNYAYAVTRRNVRKILQDYLRKRNLKIHRALVAPCGTNADLDILEGLAKEFFGIDVSKKAIDNCPGLVNKKVGNILESGYESNYFDAVASFLFFHHLNKVGFKEYLNEFYRILKKDGLLFILEPGSLYPLNCIMSLGRKLFGNISGLNPDESQVSPPKLTNALLKSGFRVVKFRSVSFSHVRIPVLLQKTINLFLGPIQNLPVFDQTGWMLLWICRKQ